MKRQLKILFNEHIDDLRSYAWFKVKDEELANDIVQEAFVKLWEKREIVNWEDAKGLLITMIQTLAIDHHRHNLVRQKFEEAEMIISHHSETPSHLMEQDQFKQHLENCIASLPTASKEAFIMNRILSLRYREVADKLKISLKAVEKRMGIAIQLMTNCIGHKI